MLYCGDKLGLPQMSTTHMESHQCDHNHFRLFFGNAQCTIPEKRNDRFHYGPLAAMKQRHHQLHML
jgi:hypothetical protein